MKIFLHILLFLISSSSQSFFGFGEGSVKDVNKCIKENDSDLIKESVIKRKCIEKYETERETGSRFFDFKKYFESSLYAVKLDETTLYLRGIEGNNRSAKVITGMTFIVLFYGNTRLIDTVKGNKIDFFIEPGSYDELGGKILENKKFESINKECEADTDSNCFKVFVNSIHTLNIDI